LAVLGRLFTLNPKVPLPANRWLAVAFLPAVFAVAVGANTLALWVLTWLSTGLHLPLHIAGAGAVLLCALIVTTVLWAVNLPAALPLWRTGGVLVLLTVRVGRFGYETVPSGWSGSPVATADIQALLEQGRTAVVTADATGSRTIEGEVVGEADGPPASPSP
jgi:hypothetical protein